MSVGAPGGEHADNGGNMEDLSGVVDSIIWASGDGGFCVFRLVPDGQKSPVNVTINTEAPLVGQQLSMKGQWIEHPKYGHQFKATRIQVAAHVSAAGIEKFLSSGAIEGVGPSMARRLVESFGMNTLEIIEHDPARLTSVKGIGKKTAEKLHASYMKNAELRDIMLWLEKHGVSGGYAARIYRQYSSMAISVMESDPYRLAREVHGVGFIMADAIGRSIGIERDDRQRISAGLEYTLQQCSSNGHCCVPDEYLAGQAQRLLGINLELIRDVLQEDLSSGVLEQEINGTETLVYPVNLYHAERFVAEELTFLKKRAAEFEISDSAEKVREWEEETEVRLAPEQRRAIEAVLSEGVFVLTGGPGTGKTTVIRGMIDLLEKEGLEIMLGAPTGRAAKRLSEATGRKAATIHRLLQVRSVDDEMFDDEGGGPLEADVIVLDEVSMMDIVLMSRFLEAVQEGTHLILVGDVDQLPAVGPGSVLKDILRSGAVANVRLSRVFRQGDGSNIVMNAHAINAGRMPELGAENEDFFFLGEEDAQSVENYIVSRSVSYAMLKVEAQVLSPMHRGVCGVERLNKLLQEAHNPPGLGKKELKSGANLFRVGDKVMQNRNNYDKNVFNGDVGYIRNISDDELVVDYPDNKGVSYSASEAVELQLAYCMSVHKSQGSEYPVVIMPMVNAHYVMLQRNLLYTAVTRAKKAVILIGSKAALFTAVSNDRTRKRYSLLAERLHAYK